MKKINIAITGTFDVENYGDLMFPVIFEKAMRDRGLDFELFMFSPLETAKKALDDSAVVYSCDEFEELNKKYHFDALVVGGGALIHFENINIKQPGKNDFVPYINIKSWFIPIYYAIKNDIKILFNVPQAPFDLPEQVSGILSEILKQVDYISFRDNYSKENIQKICKDSDLDIQIYPDSVCNISKYIPKQDLAKIQKEIIPFEDKYAVIHFGMSLPEEAHSELIKTVHELEKNKYKVIFLPLGYTHGDDVIMNEINKKYKLNVYIPKKKLNIMEMTAILAYCDLYIGTSFHGSVVSMAYGNKAISYNYYSPTVKNIDNYKRYGVGDFLANNYMEVNTILGMILSGEKRYLPLLEKNKKLVEQHFDILYKNIVCKKHKKKNIDLVRCEFVKCIKTAEENNKEKQLVDEQLKEYKTKYEAIINSGFWKKTKIIRDIFSKRKQRK